MSAAQTTAAERRLERVCALLTILFSAMAGGYVLQGILADAEFPFVANSVAKDGLFAALCAIAWADVRRNGWAVSAVVGGHVLLVFSLLTMAAFGDTSSVAGSFTPPFGWQQPDPDLILWLWVGLATAVAVGLLWLRMRASKARYELAYLAPHQHRTAMALAEVLVVGEDERLTPEEVAHNIDTYLASFRAREKWRAKLAFSALAVYPLLRLRPPLPLMSVERRQRFVEQRFLHDVAERRLPGPLRRVVQSMLYAAQQLTFIGYWADPRTHQQSGYVPFTRRPRYEAAMRSLDPGRRPLDVRTPSEIDAERVTADIAIVGTGAAGAVLAHRLAERGREVLLLERGLHVDPSEFTEDERSQFSNLYADGGMQMSTDARFQVLQGMCVGGTTVVNNGVCFDLPDEVLERWNDPDGLDAGIDGERLTASFAELRRWLPVISQDGIKLGAGGEKLACGLAELGLDRPPSSFGIVDANLADCFGSGYCNIGCAWGKKLSALDTILPRAQAAGGGGGVRIFSECAVERVRTGRKGGSQLLECTLGDGRRLEVAANTVVLSAGALGSSLILQRSDLGGKRVGRGVSFNLGAPMTAEFPEKLDAYDGLQISHYLRPAGEEGLVVEAWFNPVGAQALFMPGWFGDHYENMLRYDHMACAGSVVGTRPNATVKPGFRGRGMKLDYEPDPGDLSRLVGGLELIGRAFLAAGALKVMPSTFRYLPITEPEDLGEIRRRVRDNTDIQLHSSHPQGGNAISADPRKGVVDPGMRLHGTDGVYVCDASVFPAAITVNPQLTVMALADYAADGIAPA